MLELKNVTKNYSSGETLVRALKGVSISFRRSEFVSVLGPSGCGKTTLLNIIGGLDRYTTGDLKIDGVSTEKYKDTDWDAYRNHSVGFVFQTYNLIPHQTVIKNVELALTLSGVKKEERRARAAAALERVGLKDQINKKPNQLSGGQMQRVAIARAIVNDPKIILADEPTGALDSETSVQVMEILKELSKTRLVIMVTHNAELAKQYSSRIITLSDGLVIGDTKPFYSVFNLGAAIPTTIKRKLFCKNRLDPIFPKALKKKLKNKRVHGENKKTSGKKKPSMSFFTALSLSFNNLFTKKARTILTSFAGSIGIIGIALILSLSSGFNEYVNDVQRDTLSQYPITITQSTVNYSSALTSLFGVMNSADNKNLPSYPDEPTVTSNNLIEDLLTKVIDSISTNDLRSFKEYLESNPIGDAANAIKYSYSLNMQVYKEERDDSTGEANNRLISPVKLPAFSSVVGGQLAGFESYYKNFENFMGNQPFLSEMIDNADLVADQYEVLYGTWPKEYNDSVIVVDEHNQISDVSLYMLGLMNDNDIVYMFHKLILRMQYAAQSIDVDEEQLDEQTFNDLGFTRSKMTYTFDDLMSLNYKVVLNGQQYKKNGTVLEKLDKEFPLWSKMTDSEIQTELNETEDFYETLKVSGIVRKKEQASTGSLTSTLIYTSAFTKKLIEKAASLEIVKQFLGETENVDHPTNAGKSVEEILYFDIEKDAVLTYNDYFKKLKTYSAVDETRPATIYIYPKDFESKEKISEYIDNYNKTVEKSKAIKYDDTVGVLMSSVTTIINAITYVLIAFVSISLVVSSIMISVITHISVLERTKEIGVLRSIGASKRDISNVFNAETFIIGLSAGVMGILITLLLTIPVNLIIYSLAGLKDIAALPLWGALALIGISVVLTVIAGLLPARSASKKDPVIALRTE